jgi:hypothetical protein
MSMKLSDDTLGWDDGETERQLALMPDGLHLAASWKARLAFQRRDKSEDVAGRRQLEGVHHIRIAVRGDDARATYDMFSETGFLKMDDVSRKCISV